MSFLEVKNINKVYEQSKTIRCQALKDVSVRINEGEFIVISGPSGSGKTTLLNVIGGLDTPNSGHIIFDGIDITKLKEKELSRIRLEKMGFIFQAYNLIPVLTAMENIEYVMILQAVPKEIRRERARKIAAQLDIESLLNKRPNEMSGGQQQRVAVARSIVTEPKLVLADEPTANLDSKTGERLMDLMKELNREKKITFLFSSHDAMIIEKAGRRLVLKDGQLAREK
ncbi:MAG: ABC transporter ATP-binding protein [bacterium]